MRIIGPASLAALLCTGLPAAAVAADSEIAAVLSDCGASNLPMSSVDACLERVRVIDETSPSPELQSLEARLEEQKHGKMSTDANGSPPPLQPLQEETVAGDPPVVAASPQPNDAEMPAASRAGMADQNTARSNTVQAENEDRQSAPDDGYGTKEQAQDSFSDDEPPIADPPDDATPDRTDDPE